MATTACHSVTAASSGLLRVRRTSAPASALVDGLRTPLITASASRPAFPCPGCGAQRLTSSSFLSRDLSARFQVDVSQRVKSSSRSSRQQQFPGLIRADWNAQVDWKEATISDARKAGDLLTSLWVDVQNIDGLVAGYKIPGQYIQMKVGDSKPAYIALASSPKESQSGTLEVLIRDNGGTSELLSNLSKGDKLFVSPVAGKGFNIDLIAPPADFPTVIIFATGSGISPIRSLIENGFDADQRKDVRLYYGAFRRSAMAFQERFKSWEESGVQVIPVFSEPPGEDGFVGFVQEKYQKDKAIEDPAKTGVVLVGQKEMCQELIDILTKQGIARERILMNF